MESSTQAQLLRHCLQNATHDTGAHPLLKTAMASLVGRISVWKIGARCARAQDVEYAVKHLTPAAPRTAAAILAPLWFGDQRIQACH